MTADTPATVRLRDGTFSDISDSFGLLPTPCNRLFARSAAVVDISEAVERFLDRVDLEGGK